MSIGQRIKELRGSVGKSQKELADEIGVSRGNVGDWELGKVKPGADALLALSKYFNVSIDWIITGEDSSHARISVQEDSALLPSEAELLAKFRMLTERNQVKVEGIIEGLLISQGEAQQVNQATSSRSKPGDGREEATGRSEAV